MVKHIYYCPFTGKDHYGEGLDYGFKSQEWYDFRVDLFEKYTVASLKAQTDRDFVFWASFRPQEIDNPTTKKIEKALTKSGIKYLMTFNGIMMTDDRELRHNIDLKERLAKTLPELKKFVGEADYVYETNIDSDDMVHRDFTRIVKGKEFKSWGALHMKEGYVLNIDGKVAEWSNPYSDRTYTIMFPQDVYFNADKRLAYLRGLKSHEEIPTLFDSEELKERLYCVATHEMNISTAWEHAYKGKECDKEILKDFGL
jgi:hypothetical protein